MCGELPALGLERTIRRSSLGAVVRPNSPRNQTCAAAEGGHTSQGAISRGQHEDRGAMIAVAACCCCAIEIQTTQHAEHGTWKAVQGVAGKQP